MPATARSMTGYGRATAQTAVGSVTIELRSTNHRYLELDQRVPNGMAALQGRLAEMIKGDVRRGRVEVLVSIRADHADQRRILFDEALLQRYHTALVDLKARFGLRGPVTLDHLLALPQAVTVVEERLPAERLWEGVQQAARGAVRDLVRARQREGAKLAADLRAQLRAIERHAKHVQRRLPHALQEAKRQLRQRLQELLGPGTNVSAQQLEQAAAIIRDVDVHEELVRLSSHIGQMRRALVSREPIGKQLDFIAQELMREVNTLGAKVNDAQATQHVVAMKGCIEKLREQIQNLE